MKLKNVIHMSYFITWPRSSSDHMNSCLSIVAPYYSYRVHSSHLAMLIFTSSVFKTTMSGHTKKTTRKTVSPFEIIK